MSLYHPTGTDRESEEDRVSGGECGGGGGRGGGGGGGGSGRIAEQVEESTKMNNL